MLFYGIAALAFTLDQATKWLIRSHVEVGESFPWGPLQISRYENSGMAGSLFQGYGTLFGFAPCCSSSSFSIIAVPWRRDPCFWKPASDSSSAERQEMGSTASCSDE